jgi:ABC-type branched-subunit amino acid transport system ATPase component
VKPASLSVDGLSVRFGGVVALESVTLQIAPGEVVGLIGPKRSWQDDAHRCGDWVRGRKGEGSFSTPRTSAGGPPAKLARIGVARSFQSLELFDDMTVLDNLRVASEPWDKWSYLTDLVWPRNPNLSAEAVTAIRVLGLEPDLMKRPNQLSYGRRRLVGIGRAVSMGPSILLLDEPAAGLDDHETSELIALIRSFAEDWGMGILLIEHDVEMVMTTCDRVYALDFGKQIASGTPQEIRQNRAVISAYLGEPAMEPL